MRQARSSRMDEPQGAEKGTIRHFDAIATRYAESYSEHAASSSYFLLRRQAIVMRYLRGLDRAAILDVGCGPGLYAGPCVARGFRYCGVDASDQMICEARARNRESEDVAFVVGNALRLGFPLSSFDGLLGLGVLEYVPQGQEMACLTEMVRVVRPGGVLILSFLNAHSPYWAFSALSYSVKKFLARNLAPPSGDPARVSPEIHSLELEPAPARKFRLKERLQVLRSIGLNVTGWTSFSPIILPPHLHKRFLRQSVRAAQELERLLPRPALDWLGTGFVVATQKPRRNGA